MDSPTIAIHIVQQNHCDPEQDNYRNLEGPNKLYVALHQPLGSTISNNYIRQWNRLHEDADDAMISLNPNEIISSSKRNDETNMAFDTPKRKLKKMGWYWGSISPEYAARLLENEQDGSFLIRDSSSECYIFSMTLKLDGEVHHARIDHSNGHFSFGGRSRKFLCTSIVDFIEQAIEYSHNGNLDFFLHREPASEGPVKFVMIPFSRMKCTSSLKHMCRFAILPNVRRDKINELSLPHCLRAYLNEPFEHNPEPLVLRRSC